MTITLPGSIGPACQALRRPGVGRAFGERPGVGSFRESRQRPHLPVVAARLGQVQMGVTGPRRALPVVASTLTALREHLTCAPPLRENLLGLFRPPILLIPH